MCVTIGVSFIISPLRVQTHTIPAWHHISTKVISSFFSVVVLRKNILFSGGGENEYWQQYFMWEIAHGVQIYDGLPLCAKEDIVVSTGWHFSFGAVVTVEEGIRIMNWGPIRFEQMNRPGNQFNCDIFMCTNFRINGVYP